MRATPHLSVNYAKNFTILGPSYYLWKKQTLEDPIPYWYTHLLTNTSHIMLKHKTCKLFLLEIQINKINT